VSDSASRLPGRPSLEQFRSKPKSCCTPTESAIPQLTRVSRQLTVPAVLPQ